MRYTLFIDESGDFDSRRGEWVVAGLLFPNTMESAELCLNGAFEGLASDCGLDETQFHATELKNRKDFEHIRAEVFERPFHTEPKCLLLAVINVAKKRLSTPEITYRLMVQDLIALADSALSIEITGLDLVIATRTINSQRQTTRADISENILATLPQAMEAGLAARGLIALSNNDQVTVYQRDAKYRWGLRVADFLANLVYHDTKSVEANLLNTLRSQGHLLTFNSFGGYEQRRANIAERDGDHVMAMQRWLLMKPTEAPKADCEEAVQRLTNTIVSAPGTTAARNSIEVLVERIQRSTSRWKIRFQAVEKLEKALCDCRSGTHHTRNSLLFRVRNYLLLTANNLGDSTTGRRLVTDQESMLTSQADNPEEFFKIMQFFLYRCEVANNELDFTESTKMAEEYLRLVDEFQALLSLLPLNPSSFPNTPSDTWIKAKTNLLRCKVLATPLSDTETLMSFSKEFRSLSEMPQSNQSRLVGHSIWATLKAGQPDKAMTEAIGLVNQEVYGFDLLWAARTAADLVIMYPEQHHDKAKKILNVLRQKLLEQQGNLELRSLLLREQAVLEWFVASDYAEAERIIHMCLQIQSESQVMSPFSLLSLQVSRFHQDALGGHAHPFADYFRRGEVPNGAENYCEACLAIGVQNSLSETSTLLKIRRAMPL